MKSNQKELLRYFQKVGGIVQYSAINRAGFITILFKALFSGYIQKLDRAIYKLSEIDDLENPDLLIASIKALAELFALFLLLRFMRLQMKSPEI